ncbi:MAG: hypothetical protein HC933_04120 [Pleurocapsa sp. SU_196_0]|nr:hypothetical protein [Pleurocapsa sp. SU_196_0]
MERPVTSWGQNLVTVMLGLWLIGGVFVDGYAHNNLRSTIESFFTPWHAALYSGYTATSLWIVWLITAQVRRGARGLTAVPRGYGLGLAGVLISARAAWVISSGIPCSVSRLARRRCSAHHICCCCWAGC